MDKENVEIINKENVEIINKENVEIINKENVEIINKENVEIINKENVEIINKDDEKKTRETNAIETKNAVFSTTNDNGDNCPIDKIVIPQSNNNAVCVALPISGGRPSKLVENNPYDFISLLKESSVAWINFPVNDISKDADTIAISLGFSSSLAFRVD